MFNLNYWILQPGDRPNGTLVSLVLTWKIKWFIHLALPEVSITLQLNLIYILTKCILTSIFCWIRPNDKSTISYPRLLSNENLHFHYDLKRLQFFILSLLSESHVSFSFSTSWKSFIFPLTSQFWPFSFSENSFSFSIAILCFLFIF